MAKKWKCMYFFEYTYKIFWQLKTVKILLKKCSDKHFVSLPVCFFTIFFLCTSGVRSRFTLSQFIKTQQYRNFSNFVFMPSLFISSRSRCLLLLCFQFTSLNPTKQLLHAFGAFYKICSLNCLNYMYVLQVFIKVFLPL